MPTRRRTAGPARTWACGSALVAGLMSVSVVACAQEAGRKYISVASYVLAGEK